MLFFTLQCSSTKYTAEQKALIEKYDVPEFSTNKLNRFALEYTQYFENFKNAKESGDSIKIQNLKSQSDYFIKRTIEIAKNMSAEDAQKWVDYSFKISQLSKGIDN